MLIDDLLNKEKWEEFLLYKTNKDFISNSEKKEIEDFVRNKEYLSITLDYVFSVPKKHIISKSSSKKRTIYTFNDFEMIILKYVSYLLYKYDDLFSPNLYSFRKNTGVKKAICNLKKINTLSNMYGYKLDISNYFNSIDVTTLLTNLKKDISLDMYSFIEKILLPKDVLYNNKIVKEEKGVMAGIPLAAFLANYYLKEVDEYFWKENLVYLRYSDDIIIFCHTKEEIEKYSSILKNKIKGYGLNINEEKEVFFDPKEKWNFLGFSFENKEIDISDNSLRKIKGKIRRSARGIRRWMLKNKASDTVALKAMNRKYNRKFYGKENNELSWQYWYFPYLTTVKSLKEIDNYMQEALRYISTGKYNKTNYEKVPYKKLKDCNYRPLVSEYYKLLFNVENKM